MITIPEVGVYTEKIIQVSGFTIHPNNNVAGHDICVVGLTNFGRVLMTSGHIRQVDSEWMDVTPKQLSK